MSHHINFRTTSQVRSAPGSGVASKVGVPTPDRPRRGRAGRFAVAAGAALVVGAGVLIADSVVEPDAPSSLSNDDPGRSQQQAVGSSSVSSHDVVDANRAATLRDLQVVGSSSVSSHDVADANRAATLRDLQGR